MASMENRLLEIFQTSNIRNFKSLLLLNELIYQIVTLKNSYITGKKKNIKNFVSANTIKNRKHYKVWKSCQPFYRVSKTDF